MEKTSSENSAGTNYMLGLTQPQMGSIVTFLSFSLFRFCDHCIWMQLEKNQHLKLVQLICRTDKNKWRVTNTSLSWIHSVITAVGSVLCFYWDPKLAEDLINRSSSFSVLLVAFSIGYFIHDLYHMLSNDYSRSSIELIPHHVLVILCFCTSVALNQYVGYAVVALLVEINSVFLHLRMLLTYTSFSKDSALYRINSLLNLGTFVLFRLITLAWMTRWLVMNRKVIPLFPYTLGAVGMATMTLINLILFYRVLHKDFLSKNQTRKSAGNKE